MRVVWTTDIHLNFLSPKKRADFFASIRECQPDAVFLTGDIAEAPSLYVLLDEMQQAVAVPIYFVLGNHDFYHASIKAVRQGIQDWCSTHSELIYLSSTGFVELTSKTVLIGHDGWGDGRYGQYHQSPVRLSDQELIRDFQSLDRHAVLAKLEDLGDESAVFLRDVGTKALELYDQVFCLTHVPAFKEACWYQGKIGNDDWLPYFTCKAVGDVLLEMMQERPEKNMTVLCGHTHHEGAIHMLPNLQVLTGSAEYGTPCISKVLEIF